MSHVAQYNYFPLLCHMWHNITTCHWHGMCGNGIFTALYISFERYVCAWHDKEPCVVDGRSIHVVDHHDDLFSWKKYNN